MAISRKILEKLNDKTRDNDEIKEFIMQLLQFESDSPGWFKTEYIKILEKSCQGEDK